MTPEEFAKTHRPNYVTEAIGTPSEYTRIKCDGDACDFYVEKHGRRNWFNAMDAHSEHVGDEITELLAEAWEQGYVFWYDNDRKPEHRDYGKGNPYCER